MPRADIINGKAAAADLLSNVSLAVNELKNHHQLIPGLAVVIVGDDPASRIYTQSKVTQTKAAGMFSLHRTFPKSITEKQLIQEVCSLNENKSVHGILVQLPLPSHINADLILDLISPEKDVDGFHPLNTGQLTLGREGMVPCPPQGCMLLLTRTINSLVGSHAVIIGR